MATKTIGHWIDGKVHEAPPGGAGARGEDIRHGDVFNPATGEVQAKVAFASAAVVDQAVESAARAADSTASSTTAGDANATLAWTSPVAGLNTSPCRSAARSYALPSIQ